MTTKSMESRKVKEKIIESRWDNHGDCCSCGWHGALYEYDLDDFEVNKGKMRLEAHCISDNEDSSDHRGVRIPITKKELNNL